MNKAYVAIIVLLLIFVAGCSNVSNSKINRKKGNITEKINGIIENEEAKSIAENPNDGVDYKDADLKTIYLAGGCFGV